MQVEEIISSIWRYTEAFYQTSLYDVRRPRVMIELTDWLTNCVCKYAINDDFRVILMKFTIRLISVHLR